MTSGSTFRIALLASIALVGAGCQSQKTPAAVTAPEPAQEQAIRTTVEVVATSSTPTPAPAPAAAPKPAAKTAPKTTTPTTRPPAVSPNRTQTVTMQNNEFSPKVLAVAVGDTVVWTNKDTVNHTTVSDNALIWDSGNLKPGQSYSRVFKAPGTYTYHCGVHPGMTGTIIVYTVTN